MVNLKLTVCTLSHNDMIVVFPCVGDAEAWARNGGIYVDTAVYNGIVRTVKTPGTYLCSRWFHGYPSNSGLTVFIKEYDTDQHHPNVGFPYRAWGVVVENH